MHQNLVAATFACVTGLIPKWCCSFNLEINPSRSNDWYSLLQVLQRKTEEAATAMRRLKELQEARKSSRDTAPNGISLTQDCSLLGSIWMYLAGVVTPICTSLSPLLDCAGTLLLAGPSAQVLFLILVKMFP